MEHKIGIGMIGTGFARRVQIPAFLACDDVSIVSIASGTLENARSTAAEFDIGHVTADWRETVSRADVDLVCITTPPNLHRDITLFVLREGKHLLCEKPMAMNTAEAEEMTAAAVGKPVLALIDHELRFQPGRLLAYKMLRDGAIGKVRHAKAMFQAPHRGDAAAPWSWWSDSSAGGGALGAIGSHVVDSFQWFLDTTISSVSCQLQTHINERRDEAGGMRQVTTDDESNMLLRFADGDLTGNATGIVSISMTELPEYRNRLEFYGTSGSMRLDHRGELYLAKPGEGEWTRIETDLGRPIGSGPDTGFARAFMSFALRIIEAVRGGRASIPGAATFEDGLRVQRVLDAARESDATGRVVK